MRPYERSGRIRTSGRGAWPLLPCHMWVLEPATTLTFATAQPAAAPPLWFRTNEEHNAP